MSESSITNIFSKIDLTDLMVLTNQAKVINILPGMTGRISELVINSSATGAEFICFQGNVPFLIKSEDLNNLISECRDSLSELYEINPSFLVAIGYEYLNLEEINMYKPASGYLYNKCKADKMKKFIIITQDRKLLGLTYFSLILNRIKRKLEEYY